MTKFEQIGKRTSCVAEKEILQQHIQFNNAESSEVDGYGYTVLMTAS